METKCPLSLPCRDGFSVFCRARNFHGAEGHNRTQGWGCQGIGSRPEFKSPEPLPFVGCVTTNEEGNCISFCGCHNNLPQMWLLKTTKMYPITILEYRSLKSRYRQNHAPTKGPGGNFSFPLLAAGGFCQYLVFLEL